TFVREVLLPASWPTEHAADNSERMSRSPSVLPAKYSGTLFVGDNLDILRRHLPNGSVDLVYLDPPFQSGKTYHLYTGVRAAAPGPMAFDDTWTFGPHTKWALDRLVNEGDAV